METSVVEIGLESCDGQTQYAPLAVLGYWLQRTQFLAPLWAPLTWPVKTVQHTPIAKLETLLASILAGNRALSQINSTIRPDFALARAWGQAQFAEQSTLAEFLDSASDVQISQLQAGCAALLQQHSRVLQHDFTHQQLILDLDATALLISKRAEGSQAGWFSDQRHHYGRQLVRICASSYHETLVSALYPGNTQIVHTLRPALQDLVQRLALTPAQVHQIVIRTDAGLGIDANINWLLWAGYQVLTKGMSHMRAKAQARRVPEADWLRDPQRERWIAPAPQPPRFARRTQVYVLRWPSKQGPRYSTLISTLPDLAPLATWQAYDARGAAENEFRGDKQGLQLPKRRKRHWAAQMVLILLTDVAHNLLAWLQPAVLAEGPCAGFGPLRMVQDLLNIPGRLEFMGDDLHKVALLDTHPFAATMRSALTELLSKSSIP